MTNGLTLSNKLLAASASVLLLSVANASAGTVADFNLIAFGELSGTSNVEGRTAVFGDLVGGSKNFATVGTFNSAPASTPGLQPNDALLVGGSIGAGNPLNVNNGGNTRVGGEISNRIINSNGGGTVTPDDAGVAAILSDLNSSVLQAESFLSGLPANSTIDLSDQNRAVFNSTPDANGIAVFESPGTDLFLRNGTFDLEGDLDAELFVIRVTGEEDIITSGLNPNSNEFNDPEFQSRIVFLFEDATLGSTDLQFQGGLGGSLFAREANLLVQGGELQGTVIANDVVLNSVVRLPTISLAAATAAGGLGAVPEPSSAALAALLGTMLVARRRA